MVVAEPHSATLATGRRTTDALSSAAVPILLFLLAALCGVWAAYNRDAALVRCGLILVGVILAWSAGWAQRRIGEDAMALLAIAAGVLAALIGAYFILAYDWRLTGSAKFALLQQAGLWIQAHRPDLHLPEDINGNVAGGALALLLPLGVGGLIWAWRNSRLSLAIVSSATFVVSAVALLLTASRGAWLGLATGGLVAIWVVRQRRQPAWRGWQIDLLLGGALVLLACFFAVAVTFPVVTRPLGGVGDVGAVPAGGAAMGRAELWNDMLPLVADYPFTGSGLASTMMVYSTYVALLHVGFIGHAHNLFLQLAIEQGLPGLLAFVWLVLASARCVLRGAIGPERVENGTGSGLPLSLAVLASLVALTVHGMVDAGLYSSKAVPAMFLPIGMGLGAGWPGHLGQTNRSRFRLGTGALYVACLLAGFLAFVVWPAGQAVWQANLGAVAQTRAELSVYRWPDVPIQDALRRSPGVDLGPALDHYQKALAANPANVTANRRLGQIELSQGHYAAARDHLATAYAIAPGERATRQLLGESQAILGNMAEAAALWRTVDTSRQQLVIRQWWYEYNSEPQLAQLIAEAAKLAENTLSNQAVPPD